MCKHLPRLHKVPSPAPPPQHAAGGQEPYSSCPVPHTSKVHTRGRPWLPTAPRPATQPSPRRQAPHPAGSSAAAAASAPSCAASPEPRAPARCHGNGQTEPARMRRYPPWRPPSPGPVACGAGKWWWWWWWCPARGPSQRGLCRVCNRRAAERWFLPSSVLHHAGFQPAFQQN